MILHPIGYVRSPRSEPVEEDWDTITSLVELDGARFGSHALRGLDEYTHVEVVYVVENPKPAPRSDVGIFAQRAGDRPNRLGVTRCRLLGIGDLTIKVRGLDALDGSPVLDVQPCVGEGIRTSETTVKVKERAVKVKDKAKPKVKAAG